MRITRLLSFPLSFFTKHKNMIDAESVKEIISQTDNDILVWEQINERFDEFRSVNGGMPLIVEKHQFRAILLTEGNFNRSFMSSDYVVLGLVNAIERQLNRNKLDSEFATLINEYGGRK